MLVTVQTLCTSRDSNAGQQCESCKVALGMEICSRSDCSSSLYLANNIIHVNLFYRTLNKFCLFLPLKASKFDPERPCWHLALQFGLALMNTSDPDNDIMNTIYPSN